MLRHVDFDQGRLPADVASCFGDIGRNCSQLSEGGTVMAEAATKYPVQNETQAGDRPVPWRPFENFRREMDRLFDDFQLGSWRSPFGRTVFDVEPFWRGEVSW